MDKHLQAIHEFSKAKLKEGSVQEMGAVLYDTLFGNTQYPQFELDKLTALPDDVYENTQEINTTTGVIRFGYCGHEYKVNIELVQ